MLYRIHLWQHPQIMASKDLPPRKRMRERLNEVFAAYRPRRSKDRVFHELDVAPDDNAFPRLLKQFRKEVNDTAGVGGYFNCSLAPAELPRARYLQVRIAGDPVDWEDDGGRWLNEYPPLCPVCCYPDFEKPPRPFLVSDEILNKPTQEVFSTSPGALVVRDRVANLLRGAIGPQVEITPARVAGATKSSGLSLVRPLAKIGPDVNARPMKRCPRCRRVTEHRLVLRGRMEDRLNDYRGTVGHFPGEPVDLATSDSFFGEIGGRGAFYFHVTLSGALYAYLKAAGVTGISVPDRECWFSDEGEAPLEPAARTIGGDGTGARRVAARKAKNVAGRHDVERLKNVPWDHHTDGHVYFHLSTPRFVVADPMLLAGGGKTYRVKNFAPGLYRLPVTAIKGTADRRPGVDVDGASLVFVDEAYFGAFAEAMEQADGPRRGRHEAHLQKVAERIGSRFGFCSAVVRKWRSDFGGDGRYGIDPRAAEPARPPKAPARVRPARTA